MRSIGRSLKGTLDSRVEVRCPGCGNTVEVVTNAYSLIHNRDPNKCQWGEILEILPLDAKASEESKTQLRR
jgi:hypothetical protein